MFNILNRAMCTGPPRTALEEDFTAAAAAYVGGAGVLLGVGDSTAEKSVKSEPIGDEGGSGVLNIGGGGLEGPGEGLLDSEEPLEVFFLRFLVGMLALGERAYGRLLSYKCSESSSCHHQGWQCTGTLLLQVHSI